MRRLMTFPCEGALLAGSLDGSDGKVGLLIVTGGSQTRIGSHRMFERLGASLAEAGYPCFRFDRRGVGDSEGEDPGYRRSGPDIVAAAQIFRRECPDLEKIVGFGLCDGGTALSLFAAEAGLDALILANPWLVEAEADAPPPAAIRHHYRQRLLSLEGWKKLLGGSVSYGKLLRGIRKIISSAEDGLAGEVAHALARHALPLRLVLARQDGTAIAAEEVWRSAPYKKIRSRSPAPAVIDSDSHTFARRGDEEKLLAAVLGGLRTL